MDLRFITQLKWYATIAETIKAQLAVEPLRGEQPAELILNQGQEDGVGFKKKLRVIAIPDAKGKRAKQETTKEDSDDTHDEVDYTSGRPFCLLTNVWQVPIAALSRYYEQRWQLEEFIRQAKQAWHLNTFCNTDHNAIKTHIWFLFYSYCLVQLFRRQVINQAGYSHLAVGRLRQHLFCRSGSIWLHSRLGYTSRTLSLAILAFVSDLSIQEAIKRVKRGMTSV